MVIDMPDARAIECICKIDICYHRCSKAYFTKHFCHRRWGKAYFEKNKFAIATVVKPKKIAIAVAEKLI